MVKSYVKAPSLYNFIRGFGRAYKWGRGGGLVSRGGIQVE